MGKGRKPCCDKAVVKKGPWSQVEDYKLISFVQKHGHDNWRALPKLAGLARCGKSCRLRWVNYLRPDVKRGDFTLDEEEIIIKLHEELGNKWSKIASKLPGRTDNEIKNIWNTHLKKRIKVKDTTMESQSESSTSLPTSTSSNEGLDRSTIDDCSETKPSLQTSSIDDTMEQNTSSTSFNQETEDLNSIFGDLGSPNPNMAESTRDHDDKGDKGNSLEDLVEIPFEPNIDLWDLLDGDQPYSVNPNDQSNNNMNDAEGEERWWLVYLENELGLDHHETRSPQSTIS